MRQSFQNRNHTSRPCWIRFCGHLNYKETAAASALLLKLDASGGANIDKQTGHTGKILLLSLSLFSLCASTEPNRLCVYHAEYKHLAGMFCCQQSVLVPIESLSMMAHAERLSKQTVLVPETRYSEQT